MGVQTQSVRSFVAALARPGVLHVKDLDDGASLAQLASLPRVVAFLDDESRDLTAQVSKWAVRMRKSLWRSRAKAGRLLICARVR